MFTLAMECHNYAGLLHKLVNVIAYLEMSSHDLIYDLASISKC